MNQWIDYARVSSDDQSLDIQLDALHLSGIYSICEEMASSNAAGRPGLDNCLKALRAGDTLVVWRRNWLGCSLPHLVRIVAELDGKRIGFESIAEKIETVSGAGELVFHVFAALAEFERNLIRECTQLGFAAARARRRAEGRKPKLDARQIREIKRLMSDPTIPISQIAERHKASRTTIHKVAPCSAVSVGEPLSDASGKRSYRQDTP